MSSPAAVSPTRSPERELAPDAPAVVASSSPPLAQGGRWWFVFDRWLAVTEPVDPKDEFVMA